MSRTATAQEFMCNEYETAMENIVAEPEHIRWMMIEFAALHVEAALKAVVEITDSAGNKPDGSYKRNILNAYPKENII